jgi:hypothetical protein
LESIVEALIRCRKCLKGKAVRIRYAESEEEVGVLVKNRTLCEVRPPSCGHNRGTAVVAIGKGVEPIDQALIECMKRSKEKAVKVNRLGSPDQESRSGS